MITQFTHNDRHVKNDLVIFHRLEIKTGNIHQHIASTKLLFHPAPAFHIYDDAADLVIHWHVENLERFRADNSVLFHAMAELKSFDRLDKPGISKLGIFRVCVL